MTKIKITSLSDLRIRDLNQKPIRKEQKYILYWMTPARRPHFNFAIDRSVELSIKLDRPLVVLETLFVDYPWASERIHQFIIDGMVDNANAFGATGALYYPFIERRSGECKKLLDLLSKDACIIITDDYPDRYLQGQEAAIAKKAQVRVEAVDSNGLLPMRATQKVFLRAYDFRRFLKHELPWHLRFPPHGNSITRKIRPLRQLPKQISSNFPPSTIEQLKDSSQLLSRIPINHKVPPVPYRGGWSKARRLLKQFVSHKLKDYARYRNHPDYDATSGLSPYLHFGHISPHEVLEAIAAHEGWSFEAYCNSEPEHLRSPGLFGMSDEAQAFLDQVITWREIGFNFCANRQDYDRYESLPDWAQATLAKHADDPRPYLYTLKDFENAETHDDLWNAAQRQLLTEGRIHNYLRMLWGKGILHWSQSPKNALEIMIELNNKYAVDGCDPNSYTGIFWVLGRYDRPWGPERPVFGKIRYMSSASARSKLKVKAYLRCYTKTS